MNTTLLSQTGDLSEVQQAVRDHLQEGGTPASVVLVLSVLIGIVLLTVVLSKYAGYLELPAKQNQPHLFFQQLLKKLDMTTLQRRWLERMVGDLQLKQPATILLSPALFDRTVCEWQRGFRHDGKRSPSEQADFVYRIRTYLFPVVKASTFNKSEP